MNAQTRQRAEVVQALSDPSDHLLADARILLLQSLGHETAALNCGAGLCAKTLDRQRRPVLKARARPPMA
jgi:hypothetical protein